MSLIKTRKIRIGYRTYSLKENTEVLGELGYCGRQKSSGQEMEYSSNYPHSEIVDTLLHEILHACWDLHMTSGVATEEDIVTNLAHGLTQVMKDNPKLMKELQGLL